MIDFDVELLCTSSPLAKQVDALASALHSRYSSSTSLSGGNLVDGLPRALHTEAVGGPHGGWGQRLSGN